MFIRQQKKNGFIAKFSEDLTTGNRWCKKEIVKSYLDGVQGLEISVSSFRGGMFD